MFDQFCQLRRTRRLFSIPKLDSFSALEKTKTTTHAYKLNSPKFDKNRQNIYLNNLKKPKVYILDIFNIFTHQMLQKMAKVLHTDRSKTKEVPKKPEKNQNVFKLQSYRLVQ